MERKLRVENDCLIIPIELVRDYSAEFDLGGVGKAKLDLVVTDSFGAELRRRWRAIARTGRLFRWRGQD